MSQIDRFDYHALGQRVRAERTANRLTQAELASQVGLSTSFLGHVERGSRKPSLWTIFLLCKTLCISADQLIGLTEEVPIGPGVQYIVKRMLRATVAEANAILAEFTAPAGTSHSSEDMEPAIPQDDESP